jgi:hypothetical protein
MFHELLMTPLQKGIFTAERAENAEIFCGFRKENTKSVRILRFSLSARSAYSAVSGFCNGLTNFTGKIKNPGFKAGIN